ncbi:MAG: hypothetical protein ACXWFC_14035, partial [Nitrososphaeraceae archaeon]
KHKRKRESTNLNEVADLLNSSFTQDILNEFYLRNADIRLGSDDFAKIQKETGLPGRVILDWFKIKRLSSRTSNNNNNDNNMDDSNDFTNNYIDNNNNNNNIESKYDNNNDNQITESTSTTKRQKKNKSVRWDHDNLEQFKYIDSLSPAERVLWGEIWQYKTPDHIVKQVIDDYSDPNHPLGSLHKSPQYIRRVIQDIENEYETNYSKSEQENEDALQNLLKFTKKGYWGSGIKKRKKKKIKKINYSIPF